MINMDAKMTGLTSEQSRTRGHPPRAEGDTEGGSGVHAEP